MFHKEQLRELYENFYNFSWQKEEVYAEYLAQSYFYIRHSTKMLALAAGHIGFEDSKVFKRMIKHVSEEMSHEILCIKDLEAMGRSLQDYPEIPATQSLYQTQYYKIQHESPIAFLGYVYVLESICCEVVPRVLRDKVNPHYPKNTSTFLRLHSEEDPGHLEQAVKTITALKKSEQDQVAQNMLHTIQSFNHFLQDIEQIGLKKKIKKAI